MSSFHFETNDSSASSDQADRVDFAAMSDVPSRTESFVHPLPAGSTVGMVAGWGRLPVLVAQSAKRQGHRIVCAAIAGHACESLNEICDATESFGVAKMGAQLRFFRRHGVTHMTMAGKLFKADLMFKGSLLLRHFPDWMCITTVGPHFILRKKDTRDDTLLSAVTQAYLRRGIEVCPATDFAPELLVNEGILTRRKPSKRVQSDVRFGWPIAKQMGGLDIGQTITVKDQTIVAVEAVEGTDACIERSGMLCPKGGFTMIKVAKPNQDMRFDVPTIGPQTIQRLAEAGGSCLVIEADLTIVVDRDEVIQLADAAGISIVAIRDAATVSTTGQFSRDAA